MRKPVLVVGVAAMLLAGSGTVATRAFAQEPADVSVNPHAPFQRQVLALINRKRREHGCDGVSLDRRLIRAAKGHAADMAHHHYFAHQAPDGTDPGERVTDAGYRWTRYGENIAMGIDSPDAVVSGWMHSPAHRHNILDCRLDQMGVGVAFSHGKTYWVQDFGTPR